MRKLIVILLLPAILLVGCSWNNNNNNIEKSENSQNGQIGGRNNTHNVYKSPEGWSFEYPKSWDKVTDSFVQETATGKTISFQSTETVSLEELEAWIQSEIDRKLAADETDSTLVAPLTKEEKNGLTVYRYTIHSSPGDQSAGDIPTVIFFDGSKRYVFYTALNLTTEEEFNLVLDSLKPNR